MIRKERSHTTLEINNNSSPLLINYSPKKERKVKIQIGEDEIPTLFRKPGIDSEPLLTSIQNSTSLNNLPLKRNNSHHSFFGFNYHSRTDHGFLSWNSFRKKPNGNADFESGDFPLYDNEPVHNFLAPYISGYTTPGPREREASKQKKVNL
uniref:Uncharacterized protein n=1 Tax=Meloidogyne hapla TaxID=6305 RepID=A0A1I8B1C1_MELHA